MHACMMYTLEQHPEIRQKHTTYADLCGRGYVESYNRQEKISYNSVSDNAALQSQSTQDSNGKGSIEDHYTAAEW